MKAIARHYGSIGRRLAPTASGVVLPGQIHAIVPVSNLLAPTLRALAFAQATQPGHSARGESGSRRGRRPASGGVAAARGSGSARRHRVALPRDRPARCFATCASCGARTPATSISIVIPEYVVERWWQNLLHNQTALRLKAPAAVRALGDGDECSVGAAMKEEHRRSPTFAPRTCSTRRCPQSRSPRLGLTRRRQLTGLVFAVVLLALLTLLLDALGGRAVARGTGAALPRSRWSRSPWWAGSSSRSPPASPRRC